MQKYKNSLATQLLTAFFFRFLMFLSMGDLVSLLALSLDESLGLGFVMHNAINEFLYYDLKIMAKSESQG